MSVCRQALEVQAGAGSVAAQRRRSAGAPGYQTLPHRGLKNRAVINNQFKSQSPTWLPTSAVGGFSLCAGDHVG